MKLHCAHSARFNSLIKLIYFHLNHTSTLSFSLLAHKSVKFLILFFFCPSYTTFFSLPHTFIFFHPFLTSSLFPSPLSFLVILLNHYGGPSLLAGLSHPRLLPRLPSIFPLLLSSLLILTPSLAHACALPLPALENQQKISCAVCLCKTLCFSP